MTGRKSILDEIRELYPMPEESGGNVERNKNEAAVLAQKLVEAEGSLVSLQEHFFSHSDDSPASWYHQEWSDDLLFTHLNYCVEGFRESAKTTFVIKLNAIHRLSFPKKEYSYILLLMQNGPLAKAKLEDIVNTFLSEKNLSSSMVEKVKEDYSNGIFEALVKCEDGEIIPLRIEAKGKGASIRGSVWKDRRPDIVIIDDIQDLEDANSVTTLTKDWDWFLSEVKFLGRSTRFFVIGNNLGEGCIVENLRINAKSLGFKFMRVPMMTADGRSNWVERYPVDFIEEEKAAFEAMFKADIWWRERMCVIMAPASRRFTEDTFKVDNYVYVPEKTKFLERNSRIPYWTFGTLDPAISEADSSCFSAICIVSVPYDPLGEMHWYIRDILFGHWNPSQIITNIIEACVTYPNMQVFGIEHVAFQSSISHFLEKDKRWKENCRHVKLSGLKAGQAKVQRILMTLPRFDVPTVHVPYGASWVSEFHEELKAIRPDGYGVSKVDLADAFAYMEQITDMPSQWYRNRNSLGRSTISFPKAGSI